MVQSFQQNQMPIKKKKLCLDNNWEGGESGEYLYKEHPVCPKGARFWVGVVVLQTPEELLVTVSFLWQSLITRERGVEARYDSPIHNELVLRLHRILKSDRYLSDQHVPDTVISINYVHIAIKQLNGSILLGEGAASGCVQDLGGLIIHELDGEIHTPGVADQRLISNDDLQTKLKGHMTCRYSGACLL